MEREATKVIALYPMLDGKGYVDQAWEVGKKRNNPAGDQDVVEHILLSDDWGIYAEITYKDFGEEWLIDHITSIEFKNERYTEIQAKKKADREPADTARIKKVLGQNPLTQR